MTFILILPIPSKKKHKLYNNKGIFPIFLIMSGIFSDQNESFAIIYSIIFNHFPILKFYRTYLRYSPIYIRTLCTLGRLCCTYPPINQPLVIFQIFIHRFHLNIHSNPKNTWCPYIIHSFSQKMWKIGKIWEFLPDIFLSNFKLYFQIPIYIFIGILVWHIFWEFSDLKLTSEVIEVSKHPNMSCTKISPKIFPGIQGTQKLAKFRPV